MYALGYYVPSDAGAHRHPVSAEISKATSGFFRAAGIFPWEFAAKANRRSPARAPGTLHGRARHLPAKDASFYGHMLPSLEIGGWKQQSHGGRRLDRGRRCRRPGGSHHRRRTCITPCARAIWQARWLLSEANGVAERAAGLSRSSLRREFGWTWNSAPRLAKRRVLRRASVQRGSGAHDRFHASQPALSRT